MLRPGRRRSTSATTPEELAEQVTRVRAFAGYAGWGEGQLEGEIEEEAWFTAAALPDDVFTPTPTPSGARARAQGHQYRLVPGCPRIPA